MPRKKKFTVSFDGLERCNVFIKLRLTREEMEIMTEDARVLGYECLEDILREAALNYLFLTMPERADEERAFQQLFPNRQTTDD